MSKSDAPSKAPMTVNDYLLFFATDFPEKHHLSKSDTLELYDKAEKRFSNGRLEMLVDGKWLKVGRTDLKDGVSTYQDYFRNAIVYGARIDDDYIHFIDSYSDG